MSILGHIFVTNSNICSRQTAIWSRYSEYSRYLWRSYLIIVHHQVAVTKQKDSEDRSSTEYNIMDLSDPVLDFEKYMTDDDSIFNQVINVHTLNLNVNYCTIARDSAETLIG